MAVADFRAHVAYPCILLESRAFCSQEYHHDCIRWFGARHPQQAIFRLYIPNHLVANLACLLVGFVLLVCLPTQVNFVPFPKNLRINSRRYRRDSELLCWLQTPSR